MTHDHALDYALCRKILERNDFGWLGLIGSKSKAARFRSRLARDGIAPETIARLETSHHYAKPIATQVVPAETFWRAEEYHQKYLEKRGAVSCHI